ncbi:MAG: class I SAM-dependent methyltransferase [Actinobacteria bacterium]|nr:class I SAM-dependent methyltransferase [Actinomycetota bacterium]
MIRKSDYENYDYRQFWQNGGRAYEDAAERIAIRKLFKGIRAEGKIFADLGCGYGRLFEEYASCRAAIMVDYSLNNLRNAKETIRAFLNNDEEKMSRIFFIAADVNNLPLKKHIIDAAVSVRVVHHLENPGKFFSEVSRILRPGGPFIVEFANKRNLKNILKFVFGRLKTSPFNKKPLQIGETILDYHPAYIISLLRKSGFKIIKKISASNFRISFLKKYLGLKTLLFFEKLYQHIFSFIDTGPSIFLKAFLNKSIEKAGVSPYKDTDSVLAADKLDFLICPSCDSDNLEIVKTAFISCTKCKKKYSIDDGIYVFKDV